MRIRYFAPSGQMVSFEGYSLDQALAKAQELGLARAHKAKRARRLTARIFKILGDIRLRGKSGNSPSV